MPVEQIVGYYRIGLVEGVILMVFFLLAFWAITVVGRDRWISLGPMESLLARLAAAALLGSIAVGGTSGVVFNLMQPTVFSDLSVSPETARTQAAIGIALALALTTIGVIRMEIYHRRLMGPPAQGEEADWKMEPPEVAGRP